MGGSSNRLLWVFIGAVCALKLALVIDQTVSVVNQPADDLLYVSRAAHLMSGNSFGPYTDKTFLKLPGFSIALAAIGSLGISYLTALHLLYLGGALALSLASVSLGITSIGAGVLFAALALHPLTLSHEWRLILREPFCVAMTLYWLATFLWLRTALKRREKIVLALVTHSFFLCVLLFTREEEKILLFVEAAALLGLVATTVKARGRALVVLAPFMIFALVSFSLRHWAQRHYGLPILHELSEGEYPRLFREMFRVPPATENLHETLSPDALITLKKILPEVAPHLDRAMADYRRGDEGSLLFRFREQLFLAGLTPDLPAAQKYFSSLRRKVAVACEAPELKCLPRRRDLFPDLTWTDLPRVAERVGKLSAVAFSPRLTTLEGASDLGLPSEEAADDYRRVLGTDSLETRGDNRRWKGDGNRFELSPVPKTTWAQTIRCSLMEAYSRWIHSFLAFSLAILALRCLVFGVRLSSSRTWVLALAVFAVAAKITALSYVSLFLTAAVRLFYPMQILLCWLALVTIADTARSLSLIRNEEYA